MPSERASPLRLNPQGVGGESPDKSVSLVEFARQSRAGATVSPMLRT